MKLRDDIRAQVGEHVLAHLAGNRLQESANAYIYTDVAVPGTKLQGLGQEIEVEAPSALVVVDLMPAHGWAHPCEWHLYGADDGVRRQIIKASLPPHLTVREYTKMEAISAPVVPVSAAARRSSEPIRDPAVNVLPNSPGKRFAVLFSGPSTNTHLNDLEFLYRTLLDVYRFDARNVFVLNHDGTVNCDGGPRPVQRWPGDGTPYRLSVYGQGTRAGMQSALNAVAGSIGKDDLLLLHTNGYGAGPGDPAHDYCMCAYAPGGWEEYDVNDFVADLQALPPFGTLMAMMAQARSTGFVTPVLDNSGATWQHMCAATISVPGPDFDRFAEAWIAGLAGHYPNGTALLRVADTTTDGRISAAEAFAYADAVERHSAVPVAVDRPDDVGPYIFLGQPLHDLFLRDNLTDLGVEPLLDGGISTSPDIIVFNEALPDPAATLLSPPARDSDTLGDPVELGQDNYVYLRVQNRGATPTAGTAQVLWSPASTLPRPAAWHLIGTAPIPPVAPGEMAAVGPITWSRTSIPWVGHYCFIGLIDSGGDPAPNPKTIKTIDDYYHFIRASNNATWRNFDVQDMVRNATTTLPFRIQGWPRHALSADLVIDLTALPRAATVVLRLLKRLGDGARPVNAATESETTLWRRYRLTAGQIAELRGMHLRPSEETGAMLEITLPDRIDDGRYRVSVAQLVEGREMGRVTMLLGVGDHPYLANTRTHEVHRASCTRASRMAPNHRLAFSDVDRAIRRGYDGCRYCLPEHDRDATT